MHRTSGYRAALLATCVLLTLPYLVIAYPPLVDYPNHLARVFILSRYQENAAFQAAFLRNFTVIPNLGIDLVVTPLLSFMSVTVASRIFLIATTLVFALGCHLFASAVRGRASWIALPCAFMILSSPFMYGFVNYMLGIGLFLMTTAAWLHYRKHRTTGRYALVCIGSLASFVTHLSTLAFLGITIGLAAVWPVVQRRRLRSEDVIDVSMFLPLAIAFLAFRPTAGQHAPTEWNSLAGKAIALLAPLRTYNVKFDVALILLWVLLIFFAFRCRSGMRVYAPFAAAGLVMLAGFIISPKVLFTSSGADSRFVLPAIILLVVSVELTLPRRTAMGFVACALALSVVRLGTIWSVWNQLSGTTTELLAITDRLPRGATVFSAQYESGDTPDAWRRVHSLDHVIHYATIRRGAIVSTLFTVPGVQPVVWRDGRPMQLLNVENLTAVLAPYDFVWTGHAPPDVHDALAAHATVLAEHAGYELWRIERRVPASQPAQ